MTHDLKALAERLNRGIGSNGGRTAQVNAYQDLCEESAAALLWAAQEIERLNAWAVSYHKEMRAAIDRAREAK